MRTERYSVRWDMLYEHADMLPADRRVWLFALRVELPIGRDLRQFPRLAESYRLKEAKELSAARTKQRRSKKA